MITIEGIEMIARADCKDRQLYRIRSRNLKLGVFKAETGGFLGLREKFGSIFVFEEYHYENEHHATVAPSEELPDVLPVEIPLEVRGGTECSICSEPAEYVRYPEGQTRTVTYKDGGTAQAPGEWRHTSSKDMCPEAWGASVANKPLHDWLVAMEAKYPSELMMPRRAPRFTK